MLASPALANAEPDSAACPYQVSTPPAVDSSEVPTAGDPPQPLADQPVTVERQHGSVWEPVGTVTTDATGGASTAVTASKTPADNAVRLTYAGDATHAAAQVVVGIPLRRRASRVTVTGPGAVVDERASRVTVTWRADNGEGVAGRVALQVAERTVVRKGKRRIVVWRWHSAAAVTTDARGVATYNSTPRVDTRWRAIAPTLPWVTGATSGVYQLDNRPPGRPVKLPRRAPAPKRGLPVQPHAVGAGPNAVVTAIPDPVWRSMLGRTWHTGCPVGRDGLRLVRVNYWDYTGYRRRGEIVAADEVAGQVAAAFSDLYQHRIPIRSMVREDRFGWSRRLHGADDYKSMQAGNTSGFNCRGVVGNPRVRSPHAYGTAFDVNTWENPYRSAQGIVPDRWWQSRSHPLVAWRSRAHVVVRIMAAHGLHWTYGLGDTQHFDAVPPGAPRAMVVGCGLKVCE